jgi:hypothetical protein
MQDEGYKPNLAAVTHEMVLETAKKAPELFMKKGVVDIYTVLFFLGLRINQKDYQKGIRTSTGVYVRNHLLPHLLYKTTVYSGKVRNAVECVIDGKIYYNKDEMHELKPLYDKYKVLQPKNIYDYIAKEDMVDVLSIGSVLDYNKKFLQELAKGRAMTKTPPKAQPAPDDQEDFCEMVGYSAWEWEQRKKFEKTSSERDIYTAYVSDLDEFEI